MVRAADIKRVWTCCLQQAAEGKERCEKRRVLASVDRYDGIGSWPRVHGQRESLPKVAVAYGDRSHGNWRVPGGDDAAALFVAACLNWSIPSNSIPTSEL